MTLSKNCPDFNHVRFQIILLVPPPRGPPQLPRLRSTQPGWYSSRLRSTLPGWYITSILIQITEHSTRLVYPKSSSRSRSTLTGWYNLKTHPGWYNSILILATEHSTRLIYPKSSSSYEAALNPVWYNLILILVTEHSIGIIIPEKSDIWAKLLLGALFTKVKCTYLKTV